MSPLLEGAYRGPVEVVVFDWAGATVVSDPSVAEDRSLAHRTAPSSADDDRMYAAFIPRKPQRLSTRDEVVRGRPYRELCLRTAIELGALEMRACVNVDDTNARLARGEAP